MAVRGRGCCRRPNPVARSGNPAPSDAPGRTLLSCRLRPGCSVGRCLARGRWSAQEPSGVPCSGGLRDRRRGERPCLGDVAATGRLPVGCTRQRAAAAGHPRVAGSLTRTGARFGPQANERWANSRKRRRPPQTRLVASRRTTTAAHGERRVSARRRHSSPPRPHRSGRSRKSATRYRHLRHPDTFHALASPRPRHACPVRS